MICANFRASSIYSDRISVLTVLSRSPDEQEQQEMRLDIKLNIYKYLCSKLMPKEAWSLAPV